tara:strand:+ start:6274 stop:6981 length:708 start_codon:yes stop_codon:yes gene_type:complete
MKNNFYLILKATIFWFIFLFATISLAPILILFRIFSYKLALMVAKFWAYLTIKTLEYICKIKYVLHGELKGKTGVIFSKHQSTWETIFFLLIVANPIYIVKKELLYIPFFGWCLYLLNNISIDRSAGRLAVQKMMKKTKEATEKGHTVILFPEGTRVAVSDKTKLKQGGLLMIQSLNLPIIPITHNAGKFWPKHGFKKFPGTIEIFIGDSMKLQDKPLSDFKEEIELWMDSKVKQ